MILRLDGTIQKLFLALLVICMGGMERLLAAPPQIMVLDCTNSKVPADLTSKSCVVYLPTHHFDGSAFEEDGTITKNNFNGLIKAGLKKSKGQIRFFSGKNDEIDVYVVTSIPVKTSAQMLDTSVPPPVLMVSGPLTLSLPASQGTGKAIAVSQPVTLSILQTARFLLEERKRPTSLEAGHSEVVSNFLGVSFKALPASDIDGNDFYYYHLEKYKLKSDSGTLKLSFQNQNGDQQNIATVITGPPENWFLMAGGPLHTYALEENGSNGNPAGLYIGLNWSIHDIYDPSPRWLIVNLLDVNTTNPTLGVGLVGLGVGFPKMNEFVPLSTLALTGSLFYNLDLSQFQFVIMVNYDLGDIFQFFH